MKNLDLTPLKGLVNDFIEEYKNSLKNENKIASKQLYDGVRGKIKVDGKWIEVILSLPPQWKYVEYGRRPGKYPPPNAIREWIKVKPVLPRPFNNGKLPTENQLVYLISRKIATKGIPASNILSNTIDNFNLVGKIYNLIVEQIDKEINTEINAEL